MKPALCHDDSLLVPGPVPAAAAAAPLPLLEEGGPGPGWGPTAPFGMDSGGSNIAAMEYPIEYCIISNIGEIEEI